MKVLLAFLLLISGMVAPSAASEYTPENRPVLVFPGPHGGVAHQSPYPQSPRSASVWNNDACWKDCQASRAASLSACIQSGGSDGCRPQADASDRTCQRSCRSFFARPALDFLDF
jgi:hypothetical protein